MVHDLEASFLTHGLKLADDLADEALFLELRCQVRVEHDGEVHVLLGHEATLLCDVDEEIVLREADLGVTVHGELQHAVLVELVHRSRAIHLGEMCTNRV